MKVRVCPRGYTIVEAMIFLAVSGGLFVSAALVMSGQQQRTQFSQAIREVDSQIQDVLNDVTTGYYTNTGDFSCSATPDSSAPYQAPDIVPGSNSQGANKGCIFIGRVIQFAPSGTDKGGLNMYNLVGRQKIGPLGSETEVETLTETVPTVIAPTPSNGSIPPAIDSKRLSYGLRVEWVRYTEAGVTEAIGAVGFISSLGKYDSGNLVSGAQSVDLVPIKYSTLDQDSLSAAAVINDNASSSPLNPDGGVTICFNSGGTDQHGIITIGSSGRQLSTELVIKQGSC